MQRHSTSSVLCVALLCLASLLSFAAADEAMVSTAICVLQSTTLSSTSVQGTVQFVRVGASTSFNVNVSVCGLVPSTAHTVSVLQYGDLFLNDASSLGNIFAGTCNSCRNTAPGQLVGYLNDNVALNSDANGCISSIFSDSAINLNGVNSVVGRSLALISAAGKVGMCVIGRNDADTTENTNPLVPSDGPTINSVGCMFTATSAASRLIKGYINLENRGTYIEGRIFVTGLGLASTHGIHVHQKGNIQDQITALAASGHYVGNCISCRNGTNVPQEVGYLGDGYKLMSQSNVAQGYFQDVVVKLNGFNSIVGRSVIIHEAYDPTIRAAQCVIGITSEGTIPLPPDNYPTGIPYATGAVAMVYGTSPSPITNPTTIAGRVNFDLVPGTNDSVLVSYFISGLPPGNHSWHVHLFGDLCSKTGSSVSSHFVGDCAGTCRPYASPEVGQLNDKAPILADANGFAIGRFVDTVIRLSGTNSIIGRAIIIHGNGTAGNAAYVAVGAIGLSRELSTQFGADIPPVRSASCRFSPTSANPTPALDGYVTFELDPSDNYIVVKYAISGLPPGPHPWHVHVYGDILANDTALATSGHFIGTPSYRPAGKLEVGQLYNGAPLMADSNGFAYGVFKDRDLAFSGMNKIIGRALVIHMSPTVGTRIAQCVIGIQSENMTATTGPGCPALLNDNMFLKRVSDGACYLTPTSAGGSSINGNITLSSGTDYYASNYVTFNYNICGLTANQNYNLAAYTLGDLFLVDGSSLGLPYSTLANSQFVTDGTGCASGSFNDTVVSLNGPSSIMGRSIVVLSGATVVASGVVGRNILQTDEDAAQLVPRQPVVTRATCTFAFTAVKQSESNPGPAGGYMRFDLEDPYNQDSAVLVRYFLWGMPTGRSAIHVHLKGDVSDRQYGLSVGGHYIGPGNTCNGCRPIAAPEIGQLGNGYKIDARNGSAIGYFRDTVIQLNGKQTIVGRSIVIHSSVNTNSTTNRIATCVVGVANEGTPLPLPYIPPVDVRTPNSVPYVYRANAVIRATTSTSLNVSGYVEFEVDRVNNGTKVRYLLAGLPQGSHVFVITESGDGCNDGGINSTVFNGGCNTCRPSNTALQQYVGLIGNTGLVSADANGVAKGEIYDPVLTFDYMSSIIGRMLVIKNTASDSSAIIGQGVIGRVSETTTVLARAPPIAYYAACKLTSTYLSPNPVSGYIQLRYFSSDQSVRLTYTISGLADGSHPWYITTAGDVVGADAGLANGNVFMGTLTQPRPVGMPQAVGLIGDGQQIISVSGQAYAIVRDTNIALSGFNSVIGRSIIIQGNGTAGNTDIMAQCVIGTTVESPAILPPTCPILSTDPPQAICVLKPLYATELDALPVQNVSGSFRFVKLGNALQITYSVCGLSPGSYSIYVSRFGNSFDRSANSTGTIFVGDCPSCRTNAPSQAVGWIGDGQQISVTSGCVSSSFFESVATLTGHNSIVGRSLIIQTGASKVAQCVIGRGDFSTLDTYVSGDLRTKQAICNMEATSNVIGSVGGYIIFEDVSSTSNLISAKFFIYGLPEGYHEFHVHQKGDLSDPRGVTVEGHFVGNCTNCRTNPPQEVGRLGDGYPMSASLGVVEGYFTDAYGTLYGTNSIVGRSVIVHGNGQNSYTYVGMCVIGILRESDFPTALPTISGVSSAPRIVRASCKFRGTSILGTLNGYVEFEALPTQIGATDFLQSRYIISGLNSSQVYYWAIHENGNLCNENGTYTGPVLAGDCTNCPVGVTKVGYLNSGGALMPNSDGVVKGMYQENILKFYGTNSIIGRSIIIRADNIDNGPQVAMCTVGRVLEDTGQTQPDPPSPVKEASCTFEPTANVLRSVFAANVYGFARLSQTTDGILFDYRLHNLPPGAHTMVVNRLGDLISDDNGASTGSIFVGNSVVRAQVGNLDFKNIVASAYGNAYGTFTDKAMSFSGVNSVIGRSLVVYNLGDGVPGSETKIIAICTIGIDIDSQSATQTPTPCSMLDFVSEPPAPSGSDDSDAKTKANYAIAGVSIAIFVVALGAIGFLCYRKRQAFKSDVASRMQHEYDGTHGKAGAVAGSTATAPASAPAAVQMSSTVALPPNWEQHEDDSGHIYYFNTKTQESSWEPPKA